MEEIRPMVKVISHTPNMETLIASAAKLCYSNSNIDDIYEHNKSNPTDNAEFINKLIDMGHESPLEHATITFGIENVSRALLAQITRHRIATFSVQSQRYVKNTKKEYYTPEEITNNKLAKYIYDECVTNCFDKYNDIVNLLIKDGLTEKEAIEKARCVLPNAALTKLLMTMNIRSLHNFFKLRICKRAQKEIRDLALEMLRLSRAIAPSLFINAGAPCMYGNCDQGKMTCKKPYEKYNPNNQDIYRTNSDNVDKSLFTKDNFNPYGVSIVNLSGVNVVSEKISEDMKNIKNNIPIYHKVKAEDSCIDHSDAICRWLYMDTDSTFDNTLSQNKNSNHQNIYDDSSKYHGEKSESNFERDKNKILDAIAFSFGEDEDD
jgi:thymidylate synthase (FAD)